MGAVSLLRELQAEGVQFTVDGDAVTWSGGAGHMTAERLAALKSGKFEVIAALTRHSDAPSPHGQTFGGRQRTWTGKVVSLTNGAIGGDALAKASWLSRSARAVFSLAKISQSENTSVPAT